MALRVRGETVDEITGAVRVMRARALTVNAPPGAIDIVGTGGDGSGHVQHLDRRRAGRRRLRRAGGQARQPGALVEMRRCRRAGGARCQPRCRAGAGRARHRRGRHRLPDGAAPSQRHAPRRRPARRAGHCAPSSTCWGRCPTRPASAASSPAPLPRLDRADGRACWAISARRAPGWCMGRTVSTS